MAQISKIERILNLVSFLLKARQPVSWREIAGSVVGYDDKTDPKSLERRFERDKAALKELGLPLRFYPAGVREREGYMISRGDCFLEPLELLPHEVSLLDLISELAMRRGQKSPELLTALQKLRFDEGLGGGGDAGRPPGWGRSNLELDKVAAMRAELQLDRIAEALAANRRIRFTYYALSSGETRKRELDPYGLGFSRGSWYVVGWDHLREGIRQFKLSRIRGRVELAGRPQAFRVPRDFRVADHIAQPVWAKPGGGAEPVRVRVHVGADIAWFAEAPLSWEHREERDDGSVVLTFAVVDENAFLRWLLAHARHVRVLEPERLRRRVVEALEGLLARHAEREARA